MILGVTLYLIGSAFLLGHHYGYKKKAAEVAAAGEIQEQALRRVALGGWRAFTEHELQLGLPGPVCITRHLNDGRLAIYSALAVSDWVALDKLHREQLPLS